MAYLWMKSVGSGQYKIYNPLALIGQ